VAELLKEKAVPFAEILLSGMVTKVETGVGNRLSGVIFIDRKIRCDFEFPTAIYGNQRVELVTRGEMMLYVTRDSKTSRVMNETYLFRVGQHVDLKGRMQKKADGTLAFKMIPPEIMATNFSSTGP
jgi:hypothetical protein